MGCRTIGWLIFIGLTGTLWALEPQVAFPLGWYSFPQIAEGFSVGRRRVECTSDLRQRVALLHLKPRAWSEAQKLIAQGLDVRFRKIGENRWVMERDPTVQAREKRWQQNLKNFLIQEAETAIEQGRPEDLLDTLISTLTPEEIQELTAQARRLKQWSRENIENFPSDLSPEELLRTIPFQLSDVSEATRQKIQAWGQKIAEAIKREDSEWWPSDAALQAKMQILVVAVYVPEHQSDIFLRSLPPEQLLELGRLYARISKWEYENSNSYGNDGSGSQAMLEALPLRRADVSAALLRRLDEYRTTIYEPSLSDAERNNLPADEELRFKMALRSLSVRYHYYKQSYLQKLLLQCLANRGMLRALVEEAFEQGRAVRLIMLPDLIPDPALRAWMVENDAPWFWQSDRAEEQQVRPEEWALIYGINWHPYWGLAGIGVMAHPAHQRRVDASYYLGTRYNRERFARLLASLGKDASELLSQLRAETERAIQSPLAKQGVQLDGRSYRRWFEWVYRWAKAVQAEVIMELLPCRDLIWIEQSPRWVSLAQLVEAYRKAYSLEALLQLRLENGVLIIPCGMAFLDRGYDYPAAQLLALACTASAAAEKFPLDACIAFCQAVSPRQVRWLAKLGVWTPLDLTGSNDFNELPAFWHLYTAVSRLPLFMQTLQAGGYVLFDRWSPQALRQVVQVWQEATAEVSWKTAAVFHPDFANWLARQRIRIEPLQHTAPQEGGEKDERSSRSRWRLKWYLMPKHEVPFEQLNGDFEWVVPTQTP